VSQAGLPTLVKQLEHFEEALASKHRPTQTGRHELTVTNFSIGVEVYGFENALSFLLHLVVPQVSQSFLNFSPRKTPSRVGINSYEGLSNLFELAA